MPVNETLLIDAGVKAGLLTADALAGLRLQAKKERLRLLEAVTRAGRFPAASLYRALADMRAMPFLQAADLKADGGAVGKIPGRILLQRMMLPVEGADGAKLLALADPDDALSLERAERATGCRYPPALADPDTLRAAIVHVCETAWPGMGPTEPGADPVRLLDDIMKEAYLRRASDIHFEPFEKGMRIRMRVDGQLREHRRLSAAPEIEGLVNRVKVLAALDIAEQRVPQDGAMKYAVMDWNLPESDIRVAIAPTRWGERATLRVLGDQAERLSLGDLGMQSEALEEFRRAIERPHGMILVTGPTGSGKSTTLYAALRELRLDEINVLTVEDPVEQTVEGISQVQVNGNVSFADALRSFLRHDPDVILVGEIRDGETLEIGLRAAMTGHLVLSTLHTNDAVSAVTRLADIGAERFLIGSTLIGVLAQRLVRRLCPKCKRRRPAAPGELRALGLGEGGAAEIHEPVGCSFCQGSGFHGRTGVFETFWTDPELRRAIADGAGEHELRGMAARFRPMWTDCVSKILSGEISLAEALRLRPEA